MISTLMLRCIGTLALSCFCLAISAADWLMPGIHPLKMGESGKEAVVIVPPAVSEGKPLPVLVVSLSDKDADPKNWKEWADTRGALVVTWKGIFESSSDAEIEKSYTKLFESLSAVVPVHDFMRFIVLTNSQSQYGNYLDARAKEKFAGQLVIGDVAQSNYERMRPDHPIVCIVNADLPYNPDEDKVLKAGKMVRRVTVEGAEKGIGWGVVRRCTDYLFNLARVTNKEFSSRERTDNLDVIAKQIQELPGIADDETRLLYAQYLMAVPGMEKRRKDNERLADIWLDGAKNFALAKEKEDKVEGHEWLSGIIKSESYKEASGKYQREASDELKRMRRDPDIKKEIAAADLYAAAVARVANDQTPAVVRLSIRDLNELITRYPKSHAAREAEKVIDRLRSYLP